MTTALNIATVHTKVCIETCLLLDRCVVDINKKDDDGGQDDEEEDKRISWKIGGGRADRHERILRAGR